MKLLTLAAVWSPAPVYGVGHSISEASAALAARGHEVHVVSLGANPGENGIPGDVIRVHFGVDPYPFFAYNDYLQAVLENLPLSERLIQVWESSGPFDAIAVHGWQCSQAAALAQRRYGTPLFAVLHGAEAARIGGKGTREQIYAAEMEKWLCARADRVIVPDARVGQEVEKLYSIASGKVTVVPEGVAASTFDSEVDLEEFRSIFARPGDEVVLFAGRLCLEKGPDILLKAFSGILRQRPRAILVVAGDGPLQADLAQEAEQLGISGRVKWQGHIGPLVLGALYQIADVLVVPSRYEGFGRVVLEGLLHDLPVVATRTGGIPRFAEESPRGLLRTVEPGNIPALQKAVLETLQRPPSSRGNASRRPLQERIPPKYDLSASSAVLEELLESLSPARV
jgi:glycogen synthase